MNLLGIVFVSALVIALALVGMGTAIYRQVDAGRSWVMLFDPRTGYLDVCRRRVTSGDLRLKATKTRPGATVPMADSARLGSSRGRGAFFVNLANAMPFRLTVVQNPNDKRSELVGVGLGGYYVDSIIKADLDKRAFRGYDKAPHWLVQVAPYAAIMLFLMLGALLFMVYRVFGAVNGGPA